MTLFDQIENTKSLLLDLLDDAGIPIHTIVELEGIINQVLEDVQGE